MQINVYSRGARIQEKENSSTCIKIREAAFLKLLAYMDSELLLKKSSTQLVDNNKSYTLNFSQKRGLRSLLLIYTILYQKSKSIMVARIRLIRRVRSMVSILYLARCFE